MILKATRFALLFRFWFSSLSILSYIGTDTLELSFDFEDFAQSVTQISLGFGGSVRFLGLSSIASQPGSSGHIIAHGLLGFGWFFVVEGVFCERWRRGNIQGGNVVVEKMENGLVLGGEVPRRVSHRTHHQNHGHVENDESWVLSMLQRWFQETSSQFWDQKRDADDSGSSHGRLPNQPWNVNKYGSCANAAITGIMHPPLLDGR
ncbi:Acyl-lipid omega-3 desaturase (cytochrome b5), endoplasmic reticulum [Camellia lanceoleosa]|uniref:Acyl-lipid omega-3 desaturase (Cytochrome b5), endoplasmic reticulum n=1 Tax=Camellia lanceoleosa TaxID=1840588 RepID=A0ACC0FYZ8_9ERIC|nr:Acyl-lipid omega-3 desaturase (cytochrome b5), endoplasmic reticulum [Camellia lanceoleosa]